MIAELDPVMDSGGLCIAAGVDPDAVITRFVMEDLAAALIDDGLSADVIVRFLKAADDANGRAILADELTCHGWADGLALRARLEWGEGDSAAFA